MVAAAAAVAEGDGAPAPGRTELIVVVVAHAHSLDVAALGVPGETEREVHGLVLVGLVLVVLDNELRG